MLQGDSSGIDGDAVDDSASGVRCGTQQEGENARQGDRDE
jgi:hypothetical protein